MKKNKISMVTIVGARPQFIKASVISRALKDKKHNIEESILHTGQHYTESLSDNLFRELSLPEPDVNLNVGSDTHTKQTAKMMVGIENYLDKKKPDIVLVYGDTNSTLAASLVATKMRIMLAHVEAGPRSVGKVNPEDINRQVTDRLSDLLFCPTKKSFNNLINERVDGKTYLVGDIMYDSYLYASRLHAKHTIMSELPEEYVFVTLHREENTINKKRFDWIINKLNNLSDHVRIIFSVHPRTKKILKNIPLNESIRIIESQSHATTISLIKNSLAVVTDSGGLQKEAYFSKKPCITIKAETEWTELVEVGWNTLYPPLDTELELFDCISHFNGELDCPNIFGEGDTAEKILDIIEESV